MRVTPQGGSPKRGGPRQVPRSPLLKHTTAYDLLFYVTNERVFQHDTIFFVQSSAVRGLRLWHVLKENCGANVWNLKSCIYACHVIERFCIAGSNKCNDCGALYCTRIYKFLLSEPGAHLSSKSRSSLLALGKFIGVLPFPPTRKS